MKKIIVAISGASGAIYGVRLLKILADQPGIETHLVVSPAGELTAQYETGYSLNKLRSLADAAHDFENIGASIASGSYPVDGMCIAPCSIKTLSAVANSYADNLIVRAADVQLKQGRPLLLMVRETPLHRGHLNLMDQAAKAGAVIMPPMPIWYAKPESLDDLVDLSVHQLLRRLDISLPGMFEWDAGD